MYFTYGYRKMSLGFLKSLAFLKFGLISISLLVSVLDLVVSSLLFFMSFVGIGFGEGNPVKFLIESC